MCGHKFRKKCKKVCVWHEDWSHLREVCLDGYIGDGVYVSDLETEREWRKFYKDDGKLLPQYGCGKCPSCKTRFWFEKVDQGVDNYKKGEF